MNLTLEDLQSYNYFPEQLAHLDEPSDLTSIQLQIDDLEREILYLQAKLNNLKIQKERFHLFHSNHILPID